MQLVGRADLIKILISKPEELDEVAHLFGYVKVNLPADMDDGSVPKAESIPTTPIAASQRSEQVAEGTAILQISELSKRPAEEKIPPRDENLQEHPTDENTATRAKERQGLAQTEPRPKWRGLVQTAPRLKRRGLAQTEPRPKPLSPLPDVISRLRSALASQTLRGDVDVRAIVRRISRGKPIEKWPRRGRRRWPRRLQIMEDFATRLMPLWEDQKLVREALARLIPREGLEHTRLEDGLSDGTIFGRIPDGREVKSGSNTPILVISDLGLLGGSSKVTLRQWLRFAMERKSEGRRCIALTPAPPQAYPNPVRKVWVLLHWEKISPAWQSDDRSRTDQAKRLLGLLSYAVKMPPGLVRDVRRLVPGMSAVTEIDLWRSQLLLGAHPDGVMIKTAYKADLHVRFRELSLKLQRKIFERVRYWYGGYGDSIFFEAVIALGDIADRVVDPEILEKASAFIQNMAIVAEEGDSSSFGGITAERIKIYFAGLRARTGDSALKIGSVSEAYSRLCEAIEGSDLRAYAPIPDRNWLGSSDERRSEPPNSDDINDIDSAVDDFD